MFESSVMAAAGALFSENKRLHRVTKKYAIACREIAEEIDVPYIDIWTQMDELSAFPPTPAAWCCARHPCCPAAAPDTPAATGFPSRWLSFCNAPPAKSSATLRYALCLRSGSKKPSTTFDIGLRMTNSPLLFTLLSAVHFTLCCSLYSLLFTLLSALQVVVGGIC